jgi:hypothetical protein
VRINITEVAHALEAQDRLERHRPKQLERIIGQVREQLGQALPPDLDDFYRERIASVGDFLTIGLVWTEWVTKLLHVQAVPIFFDGCGSMYGLDLASGDAIPAVYFFDHEDEFSKPRWAAGSSLGTFLLLLADHDRAYEENWPERWQLSIDPDLDKCPRAPAIWDTND